MSILLLAALVWVPSGVPSAFLRALAPAAQTAAPAAASASPARDVPSPEAAARGASLVAAARAAIGGEDRLRAVKTLRFTGTFRRAIGATTTEGDMEVFLDLPSRYRRNETSGVAGGPILERTEVLNGTEVWDENAGGFGPFGFGGRGFDRGRFGRAGGGPADAPGGAQAPQIDPERLKEAQRRTRQAELSRLTLLLLLATDGTVAWVGTAQSPDGTADVVEITPQQGPVSRVFLDTASHLPLMITTSAGAARGGRGGGRRGTPPGNGASGAPAAGAPAEGVPAQPFRQPEGPRRGGQGGGPVTVETHLAEYKTVSGLKLPHLVTRGANGQTTEEWVIKGYAVNPTFRGNTFTR